jgi:hypothetical protein
VEKWQLLGMFVGDLEERKRWCENEQVLVMIVDSEFKGGSKVMLCDAQRRAATMTILAY